MEPRPHPWILLGAGRVTVRGPRVVIARGRDPPRGDARGGRAQTLRAQPCGAGAAQRDRRCADALLPARAAEHDGLLRYGAIVTGMARPW